jgi:Ca2+-transporting ATPase
MVSHTLDSLTASGSSARSSRRWTNEHDHDAGTPGYPHASRGESFGYTDSQTPLASLRDPHVAVPMDGPSDVNAHRARFLSDPEKLLVANPRKTRQSFRDLLEDPHGEAVAWHALSANRVLAQLQVDASNGLSEQEAHKRAQQFGRNALQREARAPIWVIFLMQFCNLIIILLMAAAVASIALQEFVEGIAIIAIVTLNNVIATLQENRAGNALEALAKMASPMCTVLRENGKQQKIASDMLVPGDIVLLATGDVVPADMRLLAAADCKVNEMILTGESEDVRKKASDPVEVPLGKDQAAENDKLTPANMVFASTSVSSGNATGVVVATGMRTKVGSIAALLGQQPSGLSADGTKKKKTGFLERFQPKMTPLQEALHKLGVLMGAAVLVICAVVFAVGMVRGSHDPKNADRPVWLTMIMVAVSLAVSAVPEGLPMVVTICLSTGTAEMVRRHVLVRKLAAVESLGAASVICTDKTGTLTEGRMTALKAWVDSEEYSITSLGHDPTQGELLLNGTKQNRTNNPLLHASMLSAALCCNATLQREHDPETGEITWKRFGNASEAPLVAAAAKMGVRLGSPDGNDEDYAANYPRVLEIPFNSSRKMMLTVTRVGNSGSNANTPTLGDLALPGGSRYCAHVKGAPNFILPLCAEMASRSSTGATNTRPMAEGDRAAVLEAVDELSSQALRVLAIAIHPLTHMPFSVDVTGDESSELDVDAKFRLLSAPLVFLGLVASMDPPRPGVEQSIATARTAGIRTVMITGDYLKTAAAIAKNIGLLGVGADVDEQAVDCAVLRPRGPGQYLTNPDLDEITSRVAVFARAQPEDKLEIVRSLQRQGYVTAMTGDGVNDAPALKEADIGVAMGLAGTEVAKGAADMILTTDNFCSIVEAVEKGRAIYTNIQKFVCFLLSTNFGEISIIFTAIAAGMPNPLEPLQILVLNLFADGMAAVALSLEKGDPAEMRARPRPRTQPIIHGRLWALVLSNALLIGVGALVVFATGLYWNFEHVLLDDILANGGVVSKLVNENIYVNVRCMRWQGASDDWKLMGNCAAVYADGSSVFPETTDGEYDSDVAYCRGGDYECVTEGVARAQTMSFIYITTMEMLRAYTARSFTNAVCVGFLGNGYMQLAAVGSISLTLLVTNTPVVMDELFGFAHIEWFQWLFSMGAAVVCATLSEVLKCVYRRRDRERVRWQSVTDGFDSVLLELRHLRHHVEHLEDKLEVATHKPARRLDLAPATSSSIDIAVL